MKALVFTSHFPERSAPTRAIYNKYTLGALAKLIDLQVVCPKPWWSYISKKKTIPRIYYEDTYGVQASFITYWSIPGLSFLHGSAMYVSLYPFMKPFLKKEGFDIILTSWAYPDSMAAAFFAGMMKCPIVTVVLGSDINELTNRKLLKPQIKWTLDQSDKIVSVSNAMATKMTMMGINPDKIIVQHNGVDGCLFAIRNKNEAKEKLNLTLDEKLIVFVGNLCREKGIETLIKALYHLINKLKLKKIKCAIIGDGELKQELFSQTQNLGLTENILFCGRRLPEEVSTWLNAGDVFCLPSYREGCPNVILEALASGCPVVASEVGGIPELINKNNGLMARVGDYEHFSNSLNAALEKKWNPSILRHSVQNLSWDSIALMYNKLFEEIVSLKRAKTFT